MSSDLLLIRARNPRYWKRNRLLIWADLGSWIFTHDISLSVQVFTVSIWNWLTLPDHSAQMEDACWKGLRIESTAAPRNRLKLRMKHYGHWQTNKKIVSKQYLRSWYYLRMPSDLFMQGERRGQRWDCLYRSSISGNKMSIWMYLHMMLWPREVRGKTVIINHSWISFRIGTLWPLGSKSSMNRKLRYKAVSRRAIQEGLSARSVKNNPCWPVCLVDQRPCLAIWSPWGLQIWGWIWTRDSGRFVWDVSVPNRVSMLIHQNCRLVLYHFLL